MTLGCYKEYWEANTEFGKRWEKTKSYYMPQKEDLSKVVTLKQRPVVEKKLHPGGVSHCTQKHTAGAKASRRVWQIEETGKEKCGYRAASKGDGLHMQEEGYALKEIKEDFLFSGFDRERVDLLI